MTGGAYGAEGEATTEPQGSRGKRWPKIEGTRKLVDNNIIEGRKQKIPALSESKETVFLCVHPSLELVSICGRKQYSFSPSHTISGAL